MRNELYRHQKSDKVKWILTAVAFTLVAVLLAGVCLQVFGKGKAQPSEWFKKADKPQVEQPEDKTESGMVVTATKDTGVLRVTATPLSASENTYAQTETTYVLTATVVPATAYDKAVTWSIAWKNANSTFAKGKTVTDYVDVTEDAENNFKATVTCKKSFGEQIIVTAALQSNAEIKATCTVDYKKRVGTISGSLSDRDGEQFAVVKADGQIIPTEQHLGEHYAFGKYNMWIPISVTVSNYTIDTGLNYNYLYEEIYLTETAKEELRKQYVTFALKDSKVLDYGRLQAYDYEDDLDRHQSMFFRSAAALMDYFFIQPNAEKVRQAFELSAYDLEYRVSIGNYTDGTFTCYETYSTFFNLYLEDFVVANGISVDNPGLIF